MIRIIAATYIKHAHIWLEILIYGANILLEIIPVSLDYIILSSFTGLYQTK